MTWPFENDTSGIVKRISNRSISANRKRNIFIILTIALASALLSAIVLYGFGVMQETQNRNQKKQRRLCIMRFLNNRDRNYTSKKKLRGLEDFSTHFLNR